MLETLDAVPWSELEHAYGEASEVPDLIRELASPEQEVYEGAIGRLGYTVIHQGTVYSSTAYVVPFFCELLEAPEIFNKVELLDYLATIARGASYSDVHIRVKEQRETPEMQRQIAEELSWVQAASDAVSDGYATYLRLLQSPDTNLRAYAAYTLSRCQSHATEVVPVMKQHLTEEEVLSVRASLLLSLGHVLQKNEETALFFMHRLHETEDPFVQIIVAIGCALAMKEQISQEILNVLIKGHKLPSAVRKQFSELPFDFFYGRADLDAWISRALRSIGISAAPQTVPTLIRTIKKCSRLNSSILVYNLLYLVFEDQKITRDMTVSDLTDLQRDVLTAIYETRAVWRDSDTSFTVSSFFDPIRIDPSFPALSYSIWDRDDVGAFLTGRKRVLKPRHLYPHTPNFLMRAILMPIFMSIVRIRALLRALSSSTIDRGRNF
ncbi:MAG TPA: hypothetical protein VL485_00350 [Ktedonobacteraceae bacterium]|jgi:hypothetical protein|nr:hypothetical protein [Ktedonobacteraceae bacterium]